MFEISADTFSKFSVIQLNGFIARLASYLKEVVPELGDIEQGAFLEQLRNLVRQAQGFGIITEQGIAVFAVTAGQLGLDFVEKFPGARQILAATVPESDKIDLLEAFTLNLLEILEN